MTKSDVVTEFSAWLTDFLPDDYYQRYSEYRWDLELRRDHQRAANLANRQNVHIASPVDGAE